MTFVTSVSGRACPHAHLLACLLILILVAPAPGSGARGASPASPQAALSQDAPSVTFRTEVSYVEVDARVVDVEGRFIRDLGPEDFEVFEDGTRQKIDFFALVDLPIELPETTLVGDKGVEPDVASNAQSVDGRLYLIVLDDLHTPASRTNVVKDAARRFVETKLGATDRAAVITTGGMSAARSQPFTSDRRVLIHAIDQFVGGTFARNPSLRALQTLENAAEFLAGLRGRRKALVYMSEGIPRAGRDFQLEARMAIAAATRNNVTIYAIDPRGPTLPEQDVAIEPNPVISSSAAAGLRRLPGPDTAGAERSLRAAHSNMRMLAEETGGIAVLNTNVEAGLDRIVRESSSYYLFGYYPANDRHDGRTRRIDVRTRRPGAHVLARTSYIEPRGTEPTARTAAAAALGVSAPLADAMMAPLPLNGVRLSTTAVAFKSTAANAAKASVAVVVEIGAGSVPLKQDGDVFTGALELSVAALATDGALAGGERYNLSLRLTPDTFSHVRESGFRVLSRIDLPAGRYQIRVGGRVPASGAIGTVFYDLDVPDFTSEALTMSGLLLTTSVAQRSPTPRGDPRLAQVLPSPPTAQRDFAAGDDLMLFAELYNSIRAPQSVEITTTVVAEDGGVEFTKSESRSVAEWQAGAGRYEYHLDIPLQALAPGRYVLKVDVRSGPDRADTIGRQVPFRVRE